MAVQSVIQTDNYTLYQGDCLEILPTLAAGSVDAVITDPPYSSGGAFRGDRMQTTKVKYVKTENYDNHTDFTGDNRDQRSYLYWCSLWLGQCRRIAKPGGILMMFTDWRQLPITTDAIQCGGWVWRGIVPWNKTEAARPQKGRFRQQCEYIVWATAGPMNEQSEICAPGFFTYSTMTTSNGKVHIAEKPEALMVDLMQIVRPGGAILDPFVGSGATGAAALGTGRHFVGIEIDPYWYAYAEQRIANAAGDFTLTPQERASGQMALFDEATP